MRVLSAEEWTMFYGELLRETVWEVFVMMGKSRTRTMQDPRTKTNEDKNMGYRNWEPTSRR
jgi:hypothetical protein